MIKRSSIEMLPEVFTKAESTQTPCHLNPLPQSNLDRIGPIEAPSTNEKNNMMGLSTNQGMLISIIFIYPSFPLLH